MRSTIVKYLQEQIKTGGRIVDEGEVSKETLAQWKKKGLTAVWVDQKEADDEHIKIMIIQKPEDLNTARTSTYVMTIREVYLLTDEELQSANNLMDHIQSVLQKLNNQIEYMKEVFMTSLVNKIMKGKNIPPK